MFLRKPSLCRLTADRFYSLADVFFLSADSFLLLADVFQSLADNFFAYATNFLPKKPCLFTLTGVLFGHNPKHTVGRTH
jgi:hypothetical protein